MIFGMKPLSGKAVRGVILFTIVEILTLTFWLEALMPSFAQAKGAGLAVVILAGGLFVEHYIATQVGQQDVPSVLPPAGPGTKEK